MLETNYLEYPASIQEAMGMKVDYAKLFPIYIAEQTGEGVISVTSDKQAYASGSTFYLTILLEEGYELEELSVVDNNDNEIELTKESETELSDGSIEIIMFGVMGLGSAFINAAKAKAKKTEQIVITMTDDKTDPIYTISCEGDITIKSTKDGDQIQQTYTDLSSASVSISADASTNIIIIGRVTEFGGGANPDILRIDLSRAYSLTNLNIAYNTKITELDLSACVELQNLNCAGTRITDLNTSNNVLLGSLIAAVIPTLETINLTNNNQLTQANINASTKITEIRYAAANSDVSTAIANAITNATAADGTVYTDSQGAYYSTIETAANNKGWTIEQIPA